MAIPTQLAKPLFLLVCVLLLASSPLASEQHKDQDGHKRSYSIGETARIEQLGVQVAVEPLVGGAAVFGFQVALTYQDPFYNGSPETSFLNPTFFHTSCVVSSKGGDLGTFTHTNERKTRFTVHLVQGCKDTPAGLPIPFLEVEIRCSNATKELRYLRARQEGRLFDISPTGYWQQVQTATGEALIIAEETYNIISTVLVLFDILAVTRGTLTAGRFVVKVILGAVVDAAVNSTFDYLQSEYGMRAEFTHTGWSITCRLCGRRFHRKSLAEGEHLKCLNSQCPAEVILRYY